MAPKILRNKFMKTTKKINKKTILVSGKNQLYDAPISFSLDNILILYKE